MDLRVPLVNQVLLDRKVLWVLKEKMVDLVFLVHLDLLVIEVLLETYPKLLVPLDFLVPKVQLETLVFLVKMELRVKEVVQESRVHRV